MEHFQIDWRWVALIALGLGGMLVTFLRDRMGVIYRVDELEKEVRELKSDKGLLDTIIHSDVDKIMVLAVAAQEAARMKGVELQVRDIALIIRHRLETKEKSGNARAAKAGKGTGIG